MTRKGRRLVAIGSAGAVLALALGLILVALNDQIVFFYSPSDLVTKSAAPGTRIRVGGLVAEGSFKRGADGSASFTITDTTNTVPVTYAGLLPDLFREGQGVVAEGALTADHVFRADAVLAKHDEKYMPREVADALKAKGMWNAGAAGGSPQ